MTPPADRMWPALPGSATPGRVVKLPGPGTYVRKPAEQQLPGRFVTMARSWRRRRRYPIPRPPRRRGRRHQVAAGRPVAPLTELGRVPSPAGWTVPPGACQESAEARGSAPGQERRLQLRGLAAPPGLGETDPLEPVVFLPVHHDLRAPRDLQGEHRPVDPVGQNGLRSSPPADLLLQLAGNARAKVLAGLA